MSTMSNSPASRRLLVAAAACAALTACAEEPPASPPASVPAATRQAPLGREPAPPRPVEVLRVSARRVKGDAELSRLAGPAQLARATEPVAIEVQTQEPLGSLTRASSPEIFINGERVGDTRAVPPDRLYVFLPDGTALLDVNAVTVAWLGNEPLTRSTRPATLTRQMLP
jgi:hypothetical protein